jgi:hypothetical protein
LEKRSHSPVDANKFENPFPKEDSSRREPEEQS